MAVERWVDGPCFVDTIGPVTRVDLNLVVERGVAVGPVGKRKAALRLDLHLVENLDGANEPVPPQTCPKTHAAGDVHVAAAPPKDVGQALAVGCCHGKVHPHASSVPARGVVVQCGQTFMAFFSVVCMQDMEVVAKPKGRVGRRAGRIDGKRVHGRVVFGRYGPQLGCLVARYDVFGHFSVEIRRRRFRVAPAGHDRNLSPEKQCKLGPGPGPDLFFSF